MGTPIDLSYIRENWKPNQVQRVVDYFEDIERNPNSGTYYELFVEGYVDIERFARSDNPQEMQQYKQIQDRGCCGYLDAIIEEDGIELYFGCNYGH